MAGWCCRSYIGVEKRRGQGVEVCKLECAEGFREGENGDSLTCRFVANDNVQLLVSAHSLCKFPFSVL